MALKRKQVLEVLTTMKYWLLILLLNIIQPALGQQISIGRTNDSFYIYKNDSLLLDIGFTEVSAFSEGKTWVNKGEKYAFIDSNGLFITEFKYDVVGGFENGFATVSVDSLYGFINEEGIEITAMKYDRVRKFKGGFADVQIDDLWGLIDSSGTETVDPVADLPLIRLEQKYVAMKYRGLWGVTDFKGKIVIPFTYDCILPDATAYKGSVRSSLNLQQIVK